MANNDFEIDFELDEAEAGNPEASRKVLRDLYKAINLSEHLSGRRKAHFLKCISGMLEAFDNNESTDKRGRAIAAAWGLTKPRGRNRRSFDAEFAIYERIDEVMSKSNLSVDAAVKSLFDVKDPILKLAPCTTPDNFEGIYREIRTSLEESWRLEDEQNP